ncbi:SDR family NAD(P)-dependent oxidoreductase [Thermaurantiacus sp.]
MTAGAGLEGQVALVTGAASGIGAATCAALEAAGARVLGTDMRASGALFPHDVTDDAQWEAAIAEVIRRFGRLDILVSNAGIAGAGRVVDLALADFRAQARVHVEGAFLGIARAVAEMRRQGTPASGTIVAVASVAGMKPVMQTTAYGTAKAALIAMVRAIGAELCAAGDRIRVHAVCPGGTRTPMTEARFPDSYWAEPANFANLPLRDYCRPQDVAEAIVFLCLAELPSCALVVDGGWMLSNRI